MRCLFFIILFFSFAAVCEAPDNDTESVCNPPEDEKCKEKDLFQEPRISQSVYEKARQSLWKVSNKKRSGTAFAIDSHWFITNFHVISSREEPLKNKGVRDFFLSQEGTPRKLQVNRILSISIPFDLVLMETVGSVPNYLNLADSFAHKSEDLFVFGYSKEIFKQARKIRGDVYRSQYFYSFPVHLSTLHGFSGSPLLNINGDLIGVIFIQIGSNLMGAVDLDSLGNFISKETGTSCFKEKSSETMNVEDCIQLAKKDTEKIIENKSNPLAPYQWAHLKFTNIHKKEENFTGSPAKVGL